MVGEPNTFFQDPCENLDRSTDVQVVGRLACGIKPPTLVNLTAQDPCFLQGDIFSLIYLLLRMFYISVTRGSRERVDFLQTIWGSCISKVGCMLDYCYSSIYMVLQDDQNQCMGVIMVVEPLQEVIPLLWSSMIFGLNRINVIGLFPLAQVIISDLKPPIPFLSLLYLQIEEMLDPTDFVERNIFSLFLDISFIGQFQFYSNPFTTARLSLQLAFRLLFL